MAGYRFKTDEKDLLIKIIEKAQEDAAEEAAKLEAIGDSTPDGSSFSSVTISTAKKTVDVIGNILDKIKGTSTTTEA